MMPYESELGELVAPLVGTFRSGDTSLMVAGTDVGSPLVSNQWRQFESFSFLKRCSLHSLGS